MRIFTVLIYFIAFLVSLNAQTKLSFIKSSSEFHNLNTSTLKGKYSKVCLNCHLIDNMKKAKKDDWLNPKGFEDIDIDNVENTFSEPDSFSKACLACHDGGVASLVLNAPLSPCGLKNSCNLDLSINGKNHPVFMQYDNKADMQNSFAPLKGVWIGATKVSDLLIDNKVVCTSCHSAHNNQYSNNLRTTTEGSALCLGCHKK